MRLAFLLLFAALTARAAQADATLTETGGRLTLIRTAERDWRADYCFDEPVAIMAFGRPAAEMRRSHWRVDSGEFVLTHDARGASQLKRSDGAHFTCAAVLMHTYTAVPEKNYMAFSTFSDGGVSLYTGYLLTSVYRGGAWQETDVQATYVPRAGEFVITRAADRQGAQFVYFGPRQGRVTVDAIFVIDPAIPASARLGVTSALPRANAQLKALFGYAPKEPYLVFMAAGELETSLSDHTKAGALPYQILFTMKGKGSARWAASEPLYFPKFTMHEVLHIWQKDVWGEALGADQPWVHEGAADALAYELMRRAGAYTEAKYRQVWAGVENRCAGLLAQTSMHRAPGENRFDTVYQCGALVNWMVAQALSPDNPGDGLVRFWQSMAAWDRAVVDRLPSETLYFNTVKRLGFSEDTVAALRKFVGSQPGNPKQAIAAMRQALAQGQGQAHGQ